MLYWAVLLKFNETVLQDCPQTTLLIKTVPNKYVCLGMTRWSMGVCADVVCTKCFGAKVTVDVRELYWAVLLKFNKAVLKDCPQTTLLLIISSTKKLMMEHLTRWWPWNICTQWLKGNVSYEQVQALRLNIHFNIPKSVLQVQAEFITSGNCVPQCASSLPKSSVTWSRLIKDETRCSRYQRWVIVVFHIA